VKGKPLRAVISSSMSILPWTMDPNSQGGGERGAAANFPINSKKEWNVLNKFMLDRKKNADNFL
jgi:hypothetical protein